ncbi:hypothetical protein [Pseudomonas sp. TH10]|uniref:hypothetical protein n=1 Tax=Pseudomonas sp. TH10 TaxID=2796376 RepID=UPI00191144FC|nr:hypothetical protein [Pseudomonas sp. TH10]MBK5516641.1 hypothetical protein [Pseudomonas sp. TH10]
MLHQTLRIAQQHERLGVIRQKDGSLSAQDFARGMREVDGAVSGAWMRRACTVADAATVHVGNRYFSFGNKALFWAGFQGNRLEARIDGGVLLSTASLTRFR